MNGAVTLAGRLSGRLPRPLDFARYIKLKLGIVVLASGAGGLIVFWSIFDASPLAASLAAIAVALCISQLLANGMTKPLRAMTAAARAMARGDYTRRVRATSRDEVGQLAVAFNQMAADLAAADRQRRELIANVSHELRTPIFALQAVLENVVDGVSDPRSLRTALAQTERLGRLVTELLDMSRIDAGAAALSVEEFDIAAFLDAAAGEAEVNAAAAGRRVSLVTQAVAGTGTGDAGRLHQVLANLLDNATRHSPPDGKVTLSAARYGGHLVIEVADQGPGIPPAERERVFERFTRGERAGRHGGTGLGLAIARWIVELHGGTIAVVDEPPPGCRIRVSLPAAPG